jgi:hypothetical protein
LVNSTLLAGRTFSEQEVTMRRRLGVVNEAFVKAYHPNGDPIGRVIHLRYLAQPPLNGADDTVEIIGVTRNVLNSDVNEAPFPEITVPYTLNGDRLYLLLQTSLPPQQLERAARGQVYALDKDQPVILRMVLGMGLRLVLIGIAIGCVAALAAGRLLASQLWGVSPYDPLSFAVVIALLLVVGFQACLWPARRAARVDPMVSLRQS